MMNPVRALIATLVLGLAAVALAACDPSQLAIRPVATAADLPLQNELVSSIEQVARPELYETPWDATPDPAGEIIYFTASGRFASGVYRVSPADGETTELWAGEPFTTPLGLAISSDGQQIYVADPEAAAADGHKGQIFVLSIDGGEPTPLAGTEGTAPRGLEVVNENGADVIYFSGVAVEDGQPAVMKIDAEGGSSTVLAKGEPFVEPGGIAVAHSGTVYVADRLAGGNGLAAVFQIDGSEVTTVADGFRAGTHVVGATLLLDDSALLISALALDQDSAQVLVISLPSLDKGIINKVIGMNSAAGGLHRAHNINLFAWASSTVGTRGNRQAQSLGEGGVYVVKP